MTKATANFHATDPETQRRVFFAVGDPVPDAIAATVGSHVLDDAPDTDIVDGGDAGDGGGGGDHAGSAGGAGGSIPTVPDYLDQGGPVPSGNIGEVLAWVNGDAGKAKAALAAEEASDNKPRTTLVDELNQIIAAAETAPAGGSEPSPGAGAG